MARVFQVSGAIVPSSPSGFRELGQVAPRALTAARVELHWAVQAIGAASDAFLDRAADDSQSNAHWSPELAAFVGRALGKGARAALRVPTLELLVLTEQLEVVERLALRGHSLDDALAWLGDKLTTASGSAPRQPLTTREYDMPAHPVASGGTFTGRDAAALEELARWYEDAHLLLTEVAAADARASEVRCWPHHFDIGGIIMIDPDMPFAEARQIGFGLSPGDGSYPEPYFYVTPFPVPEDTEFPGLAGGGVWHLDGFTGAVLTGTAALTGATAIEQKRGMARFLASAIKASRMIIPG